MRILSINFPHTYLGTVPEKLCNRVSFRTPLTIDLDRALMQSFLVLLWLGSAGISSCLSVKQAKCNTPLDEQFLHFWANVGKRPNSKSHTSELLPAWVWAKSLNRIGECAALGGGEGSGGHLFVRSSKTHKVRVGVTLKGELVFVEYAWPIDQSELIVCAWCNW